MFEKIAFWLNQGWIGSFLGLIGIGSGFYFYKKSIRSPKISIHTTSSRMIGWGKEESLPDIIEVRYQKQPVPRISRSIIRIWNSGTATLNKDHIATLDQLRLKLSNSESKIVDSLILKQSKSSNNFSARKDEEKSDTLLIGFDYMDPGEGAIIGIIHTDPNPDPEFHGTIKGSQISVLSKRSKLIQGLISHTRRNISTIGWITIIVGGFTTISGIFLPNEIIEKLNSIINIKFQSNDDFRMRISLFVAGALYTFPGAVLILSKRRRYPKSLDFPSPDSRKNSEDTKNEKQI